VTEPTRDADPGVLLLALLEAKAAGDAA